MNANDYKKIGLPIDTHCYYLTSFLDNTFAQEKEFFDTHNSVVYGNEMVEKYRNIVSRNYDLSLQYETGNVVEVREVDFVIQKADGYIEEGVREIFLSKDEMEAYWEQSIAAWKKAQVETAKYIKGMFPSISKAAQEIEAKHLEGTWNLTDEEKQRIIEQY